MNDYNMNDYVSLLKHHDWFYYHSDCGRTYREGEQSMKLIHAMAKVLDPSYSIYNSIAPEDFRRKVNDEDSESGSKTREEV